MCKHTAVRLPVPPIPWPRYPNQVTEEGERIWTNDTLIERYRNDVSVGASSERETGCLTVR